MVSEQREREDKYDVGPGFVVPELDDLLPEGGRTETATYRLDNTYYDTADSDLRRHRLTLRQRVGGPDAGWHLKVPAGPARTEIHSRSRLRTVPKALADPLSGISRGRELSVVATVATTRDVLRLLDADGVLLAEIADDQVQSSTPGEGGGSLGWRELEVEQGPAGDESLLRTLGDRLVEWGAAASPHPSKLGRALGIDPQPQPVPEPETLGEVLTAYVATQCTALVDGDLGLRLGRSVVHPTRVAVRRLRSTLRIFAAALDQEQAATLEAELVWWAGLLGEVRDRDVLGERLAAQVAALDPAFVLGPVAAHIESTLHTERARHLKRVTDTMRSERYLALLETLERWRTGPPFTDRAAAPAAEVKKYVKKAERTLYRRLAQAGGDVEALHRARKAGKRFRYAAELAEPVLGKQSSSWVEEGKTLQELLGEHQDSVVSAEFLRTLGAGAGADPGQNGFTYGILLAQEWQRAKRIRRRLKHRFGGTA